MICPRCRGPLPPAEAHTYNGVCEDCFVNGLPPNAVGSKPAGSHASSKGGGQQAPRQKVRGGEIAADSSNT